MTSSNTDSDDDGMVGIASEDWVPLIAASLVLVVGNVVSYLYAWPVKVTILLTPVAIGAFGGVRYLLYGSPLPDALRER